MPILASLPGYQPEAGSHLQALNSALVRVVRAVLLHPDTLSPLSDMPIAQLRCLNAVARGEGRKMQEVASELGIKLPAMSQIVERLVQREMLERRNDPRDRRVTRLHLTENANTLLQATQKIRERYLAAAVAQLDTDVIERLSADLLLLADASEKNFACQDKIHDPTEKLGYAEGVCETVNL